MDYRERFSDDEETLRIALDGSRSRIWTSLPGKITKVNLPGAMTVEVQPLIQARQSYPDGTVKLVNLPIIPDVPIKFPGGGGYLLTFPVKVGDECVLHFASRCIDGWHSSGRVSAPLDARMHDLSDAFADVGVRSTPTSLPDVHTKNVQLRSDDGQLVLDLDHDHGQITMTAPTKIVLNTPVVEVSGDMHFKSKDIHFLSHSHTQGNDSHGDGERPVDPPTPGS